MEEMSLRSPIRCGNRIHIDLFQCTVLRTLSMHTLGKTQSSCALTIKLLRCSRIRGVGNSGIVVGYSISNSLR